MTVAGLVAIIAFSILRPNNSVVYQPKSKYSEDDKRPPKVEKGFFAWCVFPRRVGQAERADAEYRVKPLLNTKEEALMVTVGLDAVCFMRFLRMCRNMCVQLL